MSRDRVVSKQPNLHASLRPMPKFRNTITEYTNVAQRKAMETTAGAWSRSVNASNCDFPRKERTEHSQGFPELQVGFFLLVQEHLNKLCKNDKSLTSKRVTILTL